MKGDRNSWKKGQKEQILEVTVRQADNQKLFGF